MHIHVIVHGMLTAAVPDPGGHLDLSVPDGTEVKGVVEILAERSPLFDPMACLGLIDGVKVPLDRTMREDETLHLYLLFGGG